MLLINASPFYYVFCVLLSFFALYICLSFSPFSLSLSLYRMLSFFLSFLLSSFFISSLSLSLYLSLLPLQYRTTLLFRF